MHIFVFLRLVLFWGKNLKVGLKKFFFLIWYIGWLFFSTSIQGEVFVINMLSLSGQSGRQSEYKTAAKLINLTVDLNMIALLEKNPEIRSN